MCPEEGPIEKGKRKKREDEKEEEIDRRKKG